jgi:glyoxylate carboligase
MNTLSLRLTAADLHLVEQKTGDIGICIGTSGSGTDMITGFRTCTGSRCFPEGVSTEVL